MFKGTHGSLMIPPFQGNSHIYFDLYFFDGSIEKKGRVVTLTAIFTFISLYALSFYNISLFYLSLFSLGRVSHRQQSVSPLDL